MPENKKLEEYSSDKEEPSGSNYKNYFIKKLNASKKEWNDWKWQIRNRIISYSQIQKFIQLSEKEIQAFKKGANISITPYVLNLIYNKGIDYPLRKTVIPVIEEMENRPEELDDPLDEDSDMVIPGLVHKYPDRVLFLTTHFCAARCRYCTRSRMINCNDFDEIPNIKDWDLAIEYIQRHKEVRDVLLSGGDFLTFSDEIIDNLLNKIRKIKHVEIIRIGTKVPVVLPQRITSGLLKVLKKYHPLYMSIHFTHPDELTKEVSIACNKLANIGIPLGSQTVLLKDINDNVETMGNLMKDLLKIRIKPYYIYSMDLIKGGFHFKVPISQGVEIIKSLRGYTTGYAIPQFVIDAPGGGGKIPINPDYVVGYENESILLKNYEGNIYKYYNKTDYNLKT